ncbi:ribonuclease P protein component [Spirochaetia bacterium]|nr:ribonuclease P protein component [Spirochaetia bacterium]
MTESLDKRRLFCFPKEERLKSRDEIQRVFKRGHSVTCNGARLFFIENGLEYNRMAFTFSRKFGNAVERNRARRLGREAYRHLRSSIKTAFDFALLVYPGNACYSGRLKELNELFFKAALIDFRCPL